MKECTIDDFGVEAVGLRSETNDFNDNGGVATTSTAFVVASFAIDVEFDEPIENDVEKMSRKVTSGAKKCSEKEKVFFAVFLVEQQNRRRFRRFLRR